MSTCATCRYFAHGDCHTDPGVPMAVREDRVACRFHALRVVRPGKVLRNSASAEDTGNLNRPCYGCDGSGWFSECNDIHGKPLWDRCLRCNAKGQKDAPQQIAPNVPAVICGHAVARFDDAGWWCDACGVFLRGWTASGVDEREVGA